MGVPRMIPPLRNRPLVSLCCLAKNTKKSKKERQNVVFTEIPVSGLWQYYILPGTGPLSNILWTNHFPFLKNPWKVHLCDTFKLVAESSGRIKRKSFNNRVLNPSQTWLTQKNSSKNRRQRNPHRSWQETKKGSHHTYLFCVVVRALVTDLKGQYLRFCNETFAPS
jgi:hypothetical protein